MEGYINQNGQLIYLSDQTFKLLPKSEQRNYKRYVKVKEPAEVSHGPESLYQKNLTNGAELSAKIDESRLNQNNTSGRAKRGRKPNNYSE